MNNERNNTKHGSNKGTLHRIGLVVLNFALLFGSVCVGEEVPSNSRRGRLSDFFETGSAAAPAAPTTLPSGNAPMPAGDNASAASTPATSADSASKPRRNGELNEYRISPTCRVREYYLDGTLVREMLWDTPGAAPAATRAAPPVVQTDPPAVAQQSGLSGDLPELLPDDLPNDLPGQCVANAAPESTCDEEEKVFRWNTNGLIPPSIEECELAPVSDQVATAPSVPPQSNHEDVLGADLNSDLELPGLPPLETSFDTPISMPIAAAEETLSPLSIATDSKTPTLPQTSILPQTPILPEALAPAVAEIAPPQTLEVDPRVEAALDAAVRRVQEVETQAEPYSTIQCVSLEALESSVEESVETHEATKQPPVARVSKPVASPVPSVVPPPTSASAPKIKRLTRAPMKKTRKEEGISFTFGMDKAAMSNLVPELEQKPEKKDEKPTPVLATSEEKPQKTAHESTPVDIFSFGLEDMGIFSAPPAGGKSPQNAASDALGSDPEGAARGDSESVASQSMSAVEYAAYTQSAQSEAEGYGLPTSSILLVNYAESESAFSTDETDIVLLPPNEFYSDTLPAPLAEPAPTLRPAPLENAHVQAKTPLQPKRTPSPSAPAPTPAFVGEAVGKSVGNDADWGADSGAASDTASDADLMGVEEEDTPIDIVLPTPEELEAGELETGGLETRAATPPEVLRFSGENEATDGLLILDAETQENTHDGENSREAKQAVAGERRRSDGLPTFPLSPASVRGKPAEAEKTARTKKTADAERLVEQIAEAVVERATEEICARIAQELRDEVRIEEQQVEQVCRRYTEDLLQSLDKIITQRVAEAIEHQAPNSRAGSVRLSGDSTRLSENDFMVADASKREIPPAEETRAEESQASESRAEDESPLPLEFSDSSSQVAAPQVDSLSPPVGSQSETAGFVKISGRSARKTSSSSTPEVSSGLGSTTIASSAPAEEPAGFVKISSKRGSKANSSSTPPVARKESIQTIRVAPCAGVVLNANDVIDRVEVENQEIGDTVEITEKQLSLIGKVPGETRLRIHFRQSGVAPLEFRVIVDSSTLENDYLGRWCVALERHFADLGLGEEISVFLFQNRIFLKGKVTTENADQMLRAIQAEFVRMRSENPELKVPMLEGASRKIVLVNMTRTP
ncbi:MAG: pilus assembly protein N-terminal domain-containing protein [Planctomycetia bacterium]|nr:pilus assembly protein N-terminal domain-containing protein [Planctomycetia bacterium]